jgi:hypothetical protein
MRFVTSRLAAVVVERLNSAADMRLAASGDLCAKAKLKLLSISR